MSNNSNPLGNPKVGPIQIAPLRPPGRDVTRKQDPEHTRERFLDDLEKVTQRRDPQPS